MRKRSPELSLDKVLDELESSPLLRGDPPEHAYLVLQKHDSQIHLETQDEDIEQQLEKLMSDRWVPLGVVAYYRDATNAVTGPLDWYSDLLVKDERRYRKLCSTVSARLEEAGRNLTAQLTQSRVISRLQ